MTVKSKSAAFTLIELMVVIFIISLVITIATLYAINTAPLRAKQAAKTIYALLELAQQQALLQPAVYSFQSSGDGFDFLRYQLLTNSFQGKWIAIRDDPFLHFYHLPNKIAAQIILLNTNMQNSFMQQINTGGKSKSMIIFFNNGDFTPFVINIGVYQNPPTYKIIGHENGIINLVEIK